MENYFGKLGATQEQALQRAVPMVEGLLKAQDDGEYELFCSFFEEAIKEAVTPDAFTNNRQQILETMGSVVEIEFITSLKRNGRPALVFKTKYSDTDEDFLVTITFNDELIPAKAEGIWIS